MPSKYFKLLLKQILREARGNRLKTYEHSMIAANVFICQNALNLTNKGRTFWQTPNRFGSSASLGLPLGLPRARAR
jgi:hypothetical protein